MLLELGSKRDMKLVYSPVKVGSEIASSTAIRKYIEEVS